MKVVRRTTVASWVKLRSPCASPVPPTIPVWPYARTDALLVTTAPTVVEPLSAPFHRTVRVNPGGKSSSQVRIVVAPLTFRPGEADAHPVGVIVHPAHGSSNPWPT